MIVVIIADDHVGHILQLVVDHHAMRLVTAGAEQGATPSQYVRQVGSLQSHRAVFHQAAKTIAKTDELHVPPIQSRFANTTNRRVEAGAIAAGGENSDVFGHRSHYGLTRSA